MSHGRVLLGIEEVAFGRADSSPALPRQKLPVTFTPACGTSYETSFTYNTPPFAMPYFKTSNEWYEQSSLLLKARPTSVCAYSTHARDST